MIKQIFQMAAIGSLVVLAACGGGGGGSGGTDGGAGSGSSGTDGSSDTSSLIAKSSVAGPLDPVQSQLDSAVFDPLSGAVAGSVLEPVVMCTNAIVNQDALDIADTVLAALQTTAANPGAADPQALAESMRAMVVDITQLLEGMAGETVDCTGQVLDVQRLQDLLTKLQGTPLAPLATALAPVLDQIIAVVGTHGASSAQLASISTLVAQLRAALDEGMAQIPGGSLATPVVGGALTTVSTALADLQAMLTAAAQGNAGTTSTALQALVDHTLVNLLTQVVPLQQIETAGGQPGVLSAQIAAAAAQLSTVIGNSVGKILTPLFNSQLLTALSPVLDPVVNTVLPALLGPIIDALDTLAGAAGGSGGSTGSSGDDSGPLGGTVLAPVVNLLQTVIGGLLGQGAGTGTGGTSSCPLANFPLLSVLCRKT